jgi:crotonobetainyl-CoA:carnitine CoA-transferase CaiB-like acyl-CoA transferase
VGLLDGYMALDLTDLRGQFCGRVLRDLGMRVIKVEPPGGDPVRKLSPFAHDRPHSEGSLRFAFLNAGKESVELDLEQPSHRERLLDLVERADVVLESFDPGILARLGLDEGCLQARNPGLIVTSISGFGQTGPYRDYRCPDLVGLAMGGMLGISGSSDLPPVQAPETQGFYFSSLYAVFGTVLALWRRAHDGRSRSVDVGVQECIAYHESIIRTFGFEGVVLTREGSQHPHTAPAELFPAADGYVHLFIAQQHWKQFLACWPDHPPELDDPSWLPNFERRAHTAWLNEQVAHFTRRFTREELVTHLQDKGVPCLPVNTPLDFMRDEQTRFRQFFRPTSHPVLGDYIQPSFPVLVDRERPPVAPPPQFGQHTRMVFEQLPPAPTRPTMIAPLRGGVRILSLTTGIAGPHASRALAQCGAEVIKIESRQGGLDAFRFFTSDGNIDHSFRYVEANLNLLSAQLNLKRTEGVQLFRELVAQSDVVVENFSAEVLPRLGLGPAELQMIKSDLIVLKMPGFGSDGPRHHWRTWGPTLNAFTGMTYLWNHPGQDRPIGYQGVYPDYVTAVLAPALVYAALLHRQRTGRGVVLDLAQAEVAAYTLGVSFLDAAINGRDPQPLGNDRPDAAPHNVYPCQGDDRWCAIVVETDDQWRRLCAHLGRPELPDDPRYRTLADRRAHLPEVDALVAEWTRLREPITIMHELQADGVPCGAVLRADELYMDPQLRARGIIATVHHSLLGDMPHAAVPLHLSDDELEASRPGPLLGEHNHHVYCDVLGYSPEQLADWQRAGIVD